MSNCRICGTRTGQHGFSWEKDKWPKNPEKKIEAGILRVPVSIVPPDEREDFLAYFLRNVNYPRIEWVDDEAAS